MFILKLMPLLKAISHLPLAIRKARGQSQKAFTLIELLIVIAIIAILVTIIIAAFGGTQKKARDARRREDLDAIKKALELAKSDSIGSTWYAACSPVAATCAPSSTTPALAPTYIRVVPADPSGGAYIYIPTPASCTYTVATNIGTCNAFEAISCIENDNTPTGDGIETKPISGPGSTCAGTKIYRVFSP